MVRVRADGEALAADAEELALYRIEVQGRADRFLEDGVQRFGQPFAGADTIDRRVLHPVGDPEVGDAWLAERFAHRAPMRRHAIPWLIQNVRIPWSA